jgi:hypothetical protein
MRIFFKIMKLLAIFLIALTLLLFTAALLLQDKVGEIVISSLNKSISTRIGIGDLRLSFLRRFPQATVDLNDAVVFSSSGFDRKAFMGINADTLLKAEKIRIEFRISDLIKENYTAERIYIRNGKLNLFLDTSGSANYDIKFSGSGSGHNTFEIRLNRITINNLDINYNNPASNLFIEGTVNNGRLKSRITDNLIEFNTDAGIIINRFTLEKFNLPKRVSAEIGLDLVSTDSLLTISKGSMTLDGYKLGLAGTIAGGSDLDLALTGENIDISGIKSWFPEKFQAKISDYNPSGILNISGSAKGPLTRTGTPWIRVSFGLEKGSVTYGRSALTINNLSFKGEYTNRSGVASAKQDYLKLNNFKGTLGSAQYTGSLFLSGFDKPGGELELKGRVYPSEIKDYFGLTEITWAEGYADMSLLAKGTFSGTGKFTIHDFVNLKPVVKLEFNSFGLGLKESGFLVSNVTGNLDVSNIATAKNLSFAYRDHLFLLDGSFTNLPEWVTGRNVTVIASASMRCEKLRPEILFPASSDAVDSGKQKRAYSLPGALVFDLEISVGDFSYRTFKAEKITGSLSYKPRLLNFKSLSLNSLSGHISGNGFVVQNSNKSFLGRGIFDLKNVNIKEAFISFGNFGQDFIKAENLEGTLSGSLSVLIPADSLLRPEIKAVTAEGNYTLKNGYLKNFEPVKALSSFIELSELENISFEELKNDFFIRNNILYVPQMDIKSSAADLSVNGKHGFDNDYEYHVSILLSQILSKKLKKSKPNTTEFGAIKDDGLGRTSLLLKIEDRGSSVKVGYDIKAAGSEIKNDIKKERQNLKSILNEEYGWFKNDTTPKQKPAVDGTPRFRITWDEGDSVKAEPETPAVKKESTIKNIFKKR